MTAVGGSIDSVGMAGRNFSVPADNEAQIKIGGFENEAAANGNGTARLIKTRVTGAVGGLTVELDHSNDDLTFLQDLANLKDFFILTVTLADETVYQGLAQIVDELQGSSQSATVAVSLAVAGILTQQ